jgi:hypothetical protein
LFQNLKAIGEELSEICVLFCKYIYIFIYIDMLMFLPKHFVISFIRFTKQLEIGPFFDLLVANCFDTDSSDI